MATTRVGVNYRGKEFDAILDCDLHGVFVQDVKKMIAHYLSDRISVFAHKKIYVDYLTLYYDQAKTMEITERRFSVKGNEFYANLIIPAQTDVEEHKNRKRLAEERMELDFTKSKRYFIQLCCSLSIDENNSRLMEYKEIAMHLKDTKEIIEIERIIREIESSGLDPVPFIFLCGSSGIGKTQTALTLREKLRSERLVLYLLGVVGDLMQLIYQPFLGISSVFLECVKSDLDLLQLKLDEISCSFLNRQSLFCYGFIKAAIQSWQEGKLTDHTPQIMQISRDRAIDIEILLGNQPVPVIIIDEFAIQLQSAHANDTDTASHAIQARFMKNLFRSLNFVLITVGTNPGAANLVHTGPLLFSREHTSVPWSYFVGTLPRFCLESSGFDLSKLLLPLKQILANSRPFFAKLAFEYIFNNADVNYLDEQVLVKNIDAICTKVADGAIRMKYFFSSQYGALGQFSIFKNIGYEQNGLLPSDLINLHYASLVTPPESGNFILDEHGCVNDLK